MRVKILGKVWRLRFVPNLSNRGDIDAPETKGKEIRIAQGLKGQERLEVILHELIHASGWHLDEAYVERFADDAARVLTRCGFKDGRNGEQKGQADN